MSRAAGVRLMATFLPALVLLGAIGQTPIGSGAQAKAWAYVRKDAAIPPGQTPDDGIRLPTTDAHYGPVKDYVEAVPQADYKHAPPAAVEAFKEIKYGVRIHWGLYSQRFSGGESWPFLQLPFDAKQEYQEAYKTWNPSGFD